MTESERFSKEKPAVFKNKSNLHRFINKHAGQFENLTETEVEVLTLVAKGLREIVIARKLEISKMALQNHKESIQQKLLIRNQADYIKYALAFGLIPF